MDDPTDAPFDPEQLDVGLLAHFVGLAANARVSAGIAASGFDGLRDSHGFVIQHLVEGPRTLSELARRQEVSVQAISKTVNELVAAGYLESATDPTDRRARVLSLSARGRAAVKRSRALRARQQATLTQALGAARVERLHHDLVDALEALGGADAVRRRAVRLPS